MGDLVRFLLREQRAAVLVAALSGALSGAGAAAVVALVHRALEAPPGEGPGAGLFAGVAVGVVLTQLVCRVIPVWVGGRAVRDLRVSLARRIVSAPLGALEALGPHRLVAVLTEDVSALSQALPEIPVVATQIVIIACAFGYLVWLSPALAAFVVALGLLGNITYQLVMRGAGRALLRARQGHDTLHARYRSLIEGIKELKLHRGRREHFVETALAASAEEVRRDSTRGMGLFAAAASWGQTQFLVGIGILVFVAPRFLPVDRGVLTGFVLTILLIAVPIELVIGALPTLERARIALGRIEALRLAPEPEGGEARAASRKAFQRLELRGLSYRYEAGPGRRDFVLGPLDLEVSPGEILFLVGGNGSGKTTLAKLLTGLYAPSAGEILLDGERVTDEGRAAYRELFSAQFVDSHLFPDLGGLGHEEGKVREYLERLELSAAVSPGALPAAGLSQGQRRRLLLLVAWLEDRPIYVFDEWAADQDPVFREVFYRDILADLRRRGKAVIVISHDERYFGVADRILRLDYGALAPVTLPEKMRS